jgi:anti-sigma factor RsiW
MRCEEFLECIDRYLDDTLDPSERASFRTHLQSCGSCRAAAAEEDPSLLFSALPSRDVDLRRVEDVTQAVLGQIRQQRLERRMHGGRRRWLAAAAAVVIGVAGVSGWRYLAPGESEPTNTIVEAAQTGEPSAPPRVEVVMPGDDVRVYQYADQRKDDTAVYFIVNPSMEL